MYLNHIFTSQETLFIYHHLVLEVCLVVSTNILKLWRISNCVLTQDNQHSPRGQGAHRCHHLREETKLSREGKIMLSHPETDDIESYNSERCFKCDLTNHKTIECHHKKQVQCFICRFYGNKDSDCWN